MSNSENERTRRQSDAKLISGGARKSPTDQLIITGKQYDDLHAEMQIVLFLRQIGDLRSAITSGQLADKTITEIVSKRDLPQAIKPAITSIAQELYEIYKQAPQNLSPFDFMSEYIAEDIAPTIYDQIEIRDPLQEGLVFHRGVSSFHVINSI